MNIFSVDRIRKDFPFFDRYNPYIFFDNAATTQKPRQVIDCLAYFYANEVAPVFRGVYQAAEHATVLYEDARKTVATFVGAQPHEIIFNSGATQGINTVAASWARQVLQAGDEIIVSQLEHNANFVAWQQLARERGVRLHIVPLLPDGLLDMAAFANLLSSKTRLVALPHVSNVLGTCVDIKEVIKQAHVVGARVLIDATQSIAHKRINVRDLDVDFLVFSGHKMLGPTGIGVLFVREDCYDQMHPACYGGGMVQEVTVDSAVWAPAPYRFEAGSPPLAQAVGLAEAIRYITKNIDFDALMSHESGLTRMLVDGLKKSKRIRVLGPVEQLVEQGHMVTFVIDGIHAHDVAAFLDRQKPAIAVAAGKQCAHSVYAALGINAAVRVSFYMYNTPQEVQLLLDYLEQLLQIL